MHLLLLNFTSLPRSQDAAIPSLVPTDRWTNSSSESGVPALFSNYWGPQVRQNTALTQLHLFKTGQILNQAASIVLASFASAKPRDEVIKLMAVRALWTCQKSGARRAFGIIIANTPAVASVIRKTSTIGTVATKIAAKLAGLATRAC